MNENTVTPATGTQLVDRVLLALEELAARSVTPDELAVALKVHRRTAARMLAIMEAAGYVQRDPSAPQRFELTYRIVTIAGAFLRRTDLVRIARRFVVRLRDSTGEAAHLAVPAGDRIVQVVNEYSTNRLTVKGETGDQVPMHCSALGKALLAFRPEDLAAVVRAGLPRLTHKTIVSPELLEAHLEQVRGRGYAVEDEELEVGVRCIAAPVWNFQSRVVASIGISGPLLRITSERIPDFGVLVATEAAELSEALGYRSADGVPAALAKPRPLTPSDAPDAIESGKQRLWTQLKRLQHQRCGHPADLDDNIIRRSRTLGLRGG